MLTALQQHRRKAAANLKPLAGRYAEHGVPQRGFQLVEYRVSQPHRTVPHRACHHAAQGIASAASLANGICHLLCHDGICRAHRVALHHGCRNQRCRGRAHQRVHLLNPCHYLYLRAEGTHHGTRHGACCHASNGFAGAGASATRPGANAVLGIVAVVGMRGAVGVLHLIVGGGTLVLVAHRKRNRRAQGEPVQHAGEDFHAVGFVARGHNIALPWTPTVQFCLNHLARKRHPCRATINHHTHAHTVGFPPGADLEIGTK